MIASAPGLHIWDVKTGAPAAAIFCALVTFVLTRLNAEKVNAELLKEKV